MIVILFVLGSHWQWLSSWITPGGLGDLMECWVSNRGQSCAKQTPSTLCYFFGPMVTNFCPINNCQGFGKWSTIDRTILGAKFWGICRLLSCILASINFNNPNIFEHWRISFQDGTDWPLENKWSLLDSISQIFSYCGFLPEGPLFHCLLSCLVVWPTATGMIFTCNWEISCSHLDT